MTRAVVADDWALVRSGAEAVLRRGGFPKVVTVATATQAVAAARDDRRSAGVVVVGLTSDMAQRDAVRELAKVEGLRIVALVAVVEPQAVVEILESGAHAAVPRQGRELDLPEAIDYVREGRRYVSPQLLGDLFDAPAALRPTGAPTVRLTDRESAVLAELVAGRTNAEIAQRLSIAPETVKTHLTKLYAKLDVRRRSEAVAVAVRNDLLRR